MLDNQDLLALWRDAYAKGNWSKEWLAPLMDMAEREIEARLRLTDENRRLRRGLAQLRLAESDKVRAHVEIVLGLRPNPQCSQDTDDPPAS